MDTLQEVKINRIYMYKYIERNGISQNNIFSQSKLYKQDTHNQPLSTLVFS